jgi:uncharacterized repeat protein (TIGR03833 family)
MQLTTRILPHMLPRIVGSSRRFCTTAPISFQSDAPAMNRNNRQQRPPRHGQPGARQPRPPRAYTASVPSIQQVTSGASVSIVLKQDQPTGREVQGVVQDLLTRGNHPRGIKVRLTDGRVGRVQRMANDQTPPQQPAAQQQQQQPSGFIVRREGRQAPTYTDIRNDDYPSLPPPRTLSDFLPETNPRDRNTDVAEEQSEPVIFVSATVKCPICQTFEGDEAAVTHHVEGHLA